MKIIFTLIIACSCFIGNSQTSIFTETLRKIELHEERNQWDDIVLLAPDLLLEDPENGIAYYYLALAFYKMGHKETANEYIILAESLINPTLRLKIDGLKNSILMSVNENELVLNAQKLEKAGEFNKAAEAWEKMWLINKENLNYALNAVNLYIELKLYLKALEILNDKTLIIDAEAIELIKLINDTKQMKTINGYKESMKQALNLMKEEKFSEAIQKFKDAIEFTPNDSEATNQIEICRDEISWDKAHVNYTIESFEEYLGGNTLISHQNEAHEIIKEKLVNFGKQYALMDDIANMERFFFKYLNNYPNGKEVQKVKQIMCDTYYQKGNNEAIAKNSYAQSEAVKNFEKAARLCVDKPDLEQKIKAANRLIIRYNRPDRFFYTYAYDKNCKIGFSFGTTNNKNVGAYVTMRFNSVFFANSSSNGTVDNNGLVTGGQFVNWGNDWRNKKATRTGTIEGLIGATKQIFYPFWIYSGIGFSYNEISWEMDIYDNLGDFYTTDWVKNSDESKFGFNFETGLIADLNGFHLRSGLKMNNFKDMTLTLGIGLSLERK